MLPGHSQPSFSEFGINSPSHARQLPPSKTGMPSGHLQPSLASFGTIGDVQLYSHISVSPDFNSMFAGHLHIFVATSNTKSPLPAQLTGAMQSLALFGFGIMLPGHSQPSFSELGIKSPSHARQFPPSKTGMSSGHLHIFVASSRIIGEVQTAGAMHSFSLSGFGIIRPGHTQASFAKWGIKSPSHARHVFPSDTGLSAGQSMQSYI